ncbi:MAG: sugar phosphate isomerase/epimerase, partial [bacterium]|nr:sugar phosphate isomerase/epimerase [bacterium]
HLDPANHMTSPRALFNSGAVIEDLFDQLGKWTKACHAKDVTFVGSPSIVAMEEVPPGTGYLDYNAFLRCMTRLDSDVPLIMEHLPDRETYAQSAGRIRKVAARQGVPL